MVLDKLGHHILDQHNNDNMQSRQASGGVRLVVNEPTDSNDMISKGYLEQNALVLDNLKYNARGRNITNLATTVKDKKVVNLKHVKNNCVINKKKCKARTTSIFTMLPIIATPT